VDTFELGLDVAPVLQLAFQLAHAPCDSSVQYQDARNSAEHRGGEQSKDGEFEAGHCAIKAHPSRGQGVT
jgi:hypothetical protein